MRLVNCKYENAKSMRDTAVQEDFKAFKIVVDLQLFTSSSPVNQGMTLK